MSEINKQLFQLIDLDRVLFKTPDYLEAVVKEAGLVLRDQKFGQELMRQSEKSYSNQNGTFFALREVRDRLGEVGYKNLLSLMADKYKADEFLYEGVTERLRVTEKLTDVRPAAGIITYGDPIDQLAKIKLVGLDYLPVLITETSKKDDIIRSWQQKDGRFKLPDSFDNQVVDEITLEDDKLSAFANMPDNSYGVWVNGQDNHTAETTLPTRVYHAKDLFESVEILYNIRDLKS